MNEEYRNEDVIEVNEDEVIVENESGDYEEGGNATAFIVVGAVGALVGGLAVAGGKWAFRKIKKGVVKLFTKKDKKNETELKLVDNEPDDDFEGTEDKE